MVQTIGEIRKTIIYPKDSYDEINQWRFNDEANCYQFAIMGMFYLPVLERLLPGEIAGYDVKKDKFHRYTDLELLNLVRADLIALGIDSEECELDSELSEGQWKIAIMNGFIDAPKGDYDFHFLRQTTVTPKGHWFQKHPYEQHPEMTDENYRIITDPAKAQYHYPYHLVKYLRLCKKK